MYCASFSPAVWRPLKTPDQLFTPPPSDAGLTFATDWESAYGGDTNRWKTEKNKANRSHLDAVTDEAKLVEAWRDAVPKVARALANVPTYMIFDDHEITDDWYLSDRWRERVTHRAVRAGDRPQRPPCLHRLPGVGQRPAEVPA